MPMREAGRSGSGGRATVGVVISFFCDSILCESEEIGEQEIQASAAARALPDVAGSESLPAGFPQATRE